MSEDDKKPADEAQTDSQTDSQTDPKTGPETEAQPGPDADAQAKPAGAAEATAAQDLQDDPAELKDRLMRAVAEAENVRRRAEKEKADARNYAVTGFARDMLAVADNLRRALDALPEETKKDKSIEAFIMGVEMTERELLNIFERQGVKKVDPEPGAKFDHNLHQAMFEVQDSEYESGAVVQVVQSGYVIKDRLLRPAMVGVAKGPAKKAEPDAPGDDGEEAAKPAAKPKGIDTRV